MRVTISKNISNGINSICPLVSKIAPTKIVIPIPACNTILALDIKTPTAISTFTAIFFMARSAWSNVLKREPLKPQDLIIFIPSKYSWTWSEASSFASTCFSNNLIWRLRLNQIIKNAIGTVQNTHRANLQSKNARRIQVIVTVIPFAINGGIVLLSNDSMLLQSAIMFVVSSDKSFVLKKLIGSFRK